MTSHVRVPEHGEPGEPWCNGKCEDCDDHRWSRESKVVAERDALRSQVQEMQDAGVENRSKIMTLCGNPREGYTPEQEILAQLEEREADLADAKALATTLAVNLQEFHGANCDYACYGCAALSAAREKGLLKEGE